MHHFSGRHFPGPKRRAAAMASASSPVSSLSGALTRHQISMSAICGAIADIDSDLLAGVKEAATDTAAIGFIDDDDSDSRLLR